MSKNKSKRNVKMDFMMIQGKNNKMNLKTKTSFLLNFVTFPKIHPLSLIPYL